MKKILRILWFVCVSIVFGHSGLPNFSNLRVETNVDTKRSEMAISSSDSHSLKKQVNQHSIYSPVFTKDYTKNVKFLGVDKQQNTFVFSEGKNIKIFDLDSKKIINSISGVALGKIARVSSDGKIATTDYKGIKIYRLNDGKILHEIDTTTQSLITRIKHTAYSMAFSHDGKFLAIGTLTDIYAKSRLILIDVRKGTILKRIKVKKTPKALAFSKDNNFLAFDVYDKLHILNLQNEKLFKTFTLTHKNVKKDFTIDTIYFSDKERKIVASNRRQLQEWNIKTGEQTKLFYSDDIDMMEGIAMSPTENIYVSTSSDGICVWDFKTGKLLDTLHSTKARRRHSVYGWEKDFNLLGNMFVAVGRGYKNSTKMTMWNMNPYNKTLAKLVYRFIDKSNYVALYEFTQKFNKHLKVVKEARVNMYKAVEKEDTLESYSWATNHIGEGHGHLLDKYMKKRYSLIENLEHLDYIDMDKRNNIHGYEWFMHKVKNNIEDKNNTRKQMYKIIKNKNLLAGYFWLYEKYEHTDIGRKAGKDILDMLYKTVKEINTVEAYLWYTKQNINLSDHMQEAVKNIYTLEYAKAKKTNTIAGYNDFIRSYPLSTQAQEATKKAYELEKDKYTEIGVLGFIGKDEKMNKQARKLLIEIKKYIENTNSEIDKYGSNIQISNYGHYMIISRMYDLARTEFGDTDAVLSLMESKNIDKYIETIKRRHTLLDYHLQDSDKDEYKRDYWRVVLKDIYNKYNTTDIEQIIHEKYKNDIKEFETFSNEEYHTISPYLKSIENDKKEKAIQTAKKIEDKITKFEEVYQKIVDEYKIESLKVKSSEGSNTEIQDTQLENQNTTEVLDSYKKTEEKKIMFSNSVLKVFITQKEIGKYIKFIVKATNQSIDAKGGLSLSFPAFRNKNIIQNIVNDGFGSVDVYPIGSKIWNGKLKKQIISDTLLLEGWNKVWKSGETKIMSFKIEKSIVNHTELKVRGIIIQGKKEIRLPELGATDQQGYPVKSFTIGETNTSDYSNVSTSQEDIIKAKSMHKLRLNKHLTLEKNSLLYFDVPKYMKPKYIVKENKYLQLRILGCNKEKGSCTGEYRTKKFIMYCDIHVNKTLKRKDNLAINLSLSIEEMKNDKTYNYDGLYYPAITKENITKTKFPISFAGKVFSFGSGDSRMPGTLFFNINETKLKKLIINKKDAGTPPYFTEDTKCVDHDDARNGEWLSEMYRRGGVLDDNGCLLKAKRNYSTGKINIENGRYATVYGLDPKGDGFLAFRTRPKGREIGRFYNGDKVEILDKKGKYYKVRDIRSGKIGWSHGKWISLGRSTLNKLTKKEKISLLHQILKQSKNNMKDVKSSIKGYLSHKNKKYTTYEHMCRPLKTNYFKCKFRDSYNNGEDEGMIEVEYEAVRNTNNVRVSKIYPVFMAD